MKLCECGCGEPAPVATRTDRGGGMVKGQPQRFVRYHHGRKSAAPACGYVVDEATGCWNWMLRVNENGYGRIKVQGRCTYAHIYHYEQRYGAVPVGLELDHICRNRRCCNPDHLEAVTRTENVRRSATTKLTPDQVAAIRACDLSLKSIARKFGVGYGTVQRIKAGTGWVSA